ncbi:MAG: EpsG family protein [Pseudomonadota bacterium]
MLPYWILFAFFAVGTAFESTRRMPDRQAPQFALIIGLGLTAVMIGSRFQVGGDWRSYEFMFSFVRNLSFETALQFGDPGYQAVNWLAQEWDGEIWWVNTVGAAIFCWGLLRLCQNQPRPLLAVLVAVPYLIIVVAMGYTRQSIAIGILMAGLASLGRGGSVIRFAFYVAIAAAFHRTAVLVLPLVIFAGERNRILNVVAGLAASVLFFDLFLSDATDQFVKAYIEARYSSQGAWIRVILNLVPAILLLTKPGRFGFTPQEERVWRYIAIAACMMPFILLASPSSTAVDRMALYLMPLQIVVLARAYLLFAKRGFGVVAVIGYCLIVQAIWLNYASHARLWLPYQSFIYDDTTNRGTTNGPR